MTDALLVLRAWAGNHRAIRLAPWLSFTALLLLALAMPGHRLSHFVFSPASANAQTTGFWPAHRHGVVYARNFVRGPNGERIFAEFGEDGAVLQEYGEEINELAKAFTLSANAYRTEVQRYEQLMADKGETDAKGALILSRTEYEATNFTTIKGASIERPPLSSRAKSVVVRNKNTLLTKDTKPLLLEAGIDLQNREKLSDEIQSVLLNEAGQILRKSAHNIGYRVAFLKPKGGEPGDCSPSYGAEEDNRMLRRPDTDEACGPIRDTLVTAFVFPGREGGVHTGKDGSYSISYMNMPCPGFNFEYTNFITPKLYYRTLNPRASKGVGMYYQMHRVHDWCFGFQEVLKNSGTLPGLMTGIAIDGILASAASPVSRRDISIDVLALTGKGYLSNSADQADAIPIGPTGYQTAIPAFVQIPPEALDLDGDRQPDPLEATPKDYNGDGVIDGYGVYLNGKRPGDLDAEGKPILPDLIRRPDVAPDTGDQGLLGSLSEADLEETDLFVYRVSNDQLIFQRKGLNPNKDSYTRGQGGGALDDGHASFYYKSIIRGPKAYQNYFGADDFLTWQTKANINPELHKWEADHLKVGERIKLIAINRKTGYIGSAITQVGNNATGGSSFLDFPIPDIVMRPPNLKIKAERQYTVEAGITQGEKRQYLIGFEGTGLTSDTTITLRTEWFDHDGTPLPADLPGYTGRLAKIVSDQTLGDNIAEFDIKPGVKLEWMRLPNDATLANDHYYVHVAGEPLEDSPDFSATGAGEGVLQSRPKHYVPFKVAVYDEVETRKRRNEQRYLKEDELLGQDTPKADAVYAWPYRPEMQFSVLDLEMGEIRRTDAEDVVTDILPVKTPLFASGDQQAELIYDLTVNPNQPLDYFGYSNPAITEADPENSMGKEMVFALGADEVLATFGTDQTVKFESLDHLALLDPEDFLTLSLFNNNDAGNVLWEWAFLAASMWPERNNKLSAEDNEIVITADEVAEGPVVLSAFLNGSSGLGKPLRLNWKLEGAGSLTLPLSQVRTNGIYSTELSLPTQADASAVVSATLEDSNTPLYSPTHRVIPGEPSRIDITSSGKTVIGGLGGVSFDILVRDAYGNPVVDGTVLGVLVDDLEVRGSTMLVDGRTTLEFVGSATPGDQSVVIRAGRAETTEDVSVHDVTLSFSGVEDIAVGSNATFTVIGSSSYGNLDGLELEVAVHRGQLDSYRVVLDTSNSGQVGYTTGRYRGFAQISAKIVGSGRMATQDFSVTKSGSYLLRNVLVPDGSGSIDVGKAESLTYGSTIKGVRAL